MSTSRKISLKSKFSLLLLAVAFLSKTPVYSETISGFVLDLDGNPVESAAVNLTGTSSLLIVTDNTGTFSFSSLVLGSSYTIRVTKSGFVYSPTEYSTSTLAANKTDLVFINGKVWSGGGSDALASNVNNWVGGVVPTSSDTVRFGSTNPTKGCRWDISDRMTRIELTVDFSSSVTAAVNMAVSTLSISGGLFHLGSQEIRLSGNFELSAGKFTSGENGITVWDGSSVQRISMEPGFTGGNSYNSYFYNFRVDNSSSVQLSSSVVVDGSFNISQGRFELQQSSMILTGASQINSPSGSQLLWDDRSGTFDAGLGSVWFDSTARSYQIFHDTSNPFYNFVVHGSSSVDLSTSVFITNNLRIGEVGSSVQLKANAGYRHTVGGNVYVGPASESVNASLLLSGSTLTVQGEMVITTATFEVNGGRVEVQGSSVVVSGGGLLHVISGSTSSFVFNDGSGFRLDNGTFQAEGGSIFTTPTPGTDRYSMLMLGTIDIQTNTRFDSMDVNGFQMGLGSIYSQLYGMEFTNGPVGGAAFNFDPVNQSAITVERPTFDVNVSTNVRAIITGAGVSTADIDVTEAAGPRAGPTYEVDTSSVVNWGTIGTPTNFQGVANGSSTIVWSWTPVNKPLGFIVYATTGGVVSSTLTLNTTSYLETRLSPNVQYSRYVEAFTDVSLAPSTQDAVYTLPSGATNFSFTEVNVTSTTLTWSANSNPSPTIYHLSRSTNNVGYTEIASGTLAGLVPYQDTNLLIRTTYYYRLNAENSDGLTGATASTFTTTLPIPPPQVYSITPSSVTNLGSRTFSITGINFITGGFLSFERDAGLKLFPTTFTVLNTSSITATFNLTGALADTTYDVIYENLDGNLSTGSGMDILTIGDAPASGSISARNYSSLSGLTFNTGSGGTTLDMPAASMADGRLYISEDPATEPLRVNSSLVVVNDNNRPPGFVLIPGTIREINAYTNSGYVTGPFIPQAVLSISYVDSDSNGVVDTVGIRAETLRMMRLNENTGGWQELAAATVDTSAKTVSTNLSNFSVYALFGSPASGSLSETIVYPNPWLVGTAGKYDGTNITFLNLTSAGTIKVYSLLGSLVKELSYDITNGGLLTWDGKNLNGENISSGVYLIRIESSDGEDRIIKLGVER